MLPAGVRAYLLTAMTGTPDVLDGFLRSTSAADPLWDARPDPERFTLREVVAHLADWEPIWLDRVRRTLAENEPSLPGYDEEQLAVDHDYAHNDPHVSLARIRSGRALLVETLRGLDDAAWQRIAHRDALGAVSVEAQAVVILGHDGYHTHEVAQRIMGSIAVSSG